ncbi:MAG: hypothetical protein ACRDK7_12610, partial [Solirubrobacteraceae bacterium]
MENITTAGVERWARSMACRSIRRPLSLTKVKHSCFHGPWQARSAGEESAWQSRFCAAWRLATVSSSNQACGVVVLKKVL